ncbi:MAG: O-methyltransferase, partial [Candidatus Dormiibacterota bacterium]
LEGSLRRSAEAGLPAIQVSPSQGRLLWLLARTAAARSILEIGTLGGYSTIWLGRALPPDGHLVTLELDAHHAAVARENVAAAGLEAVAEVRQGPAMTSLDAMVAAGEGPFDLIFVDADKSGYPDYLSGALRLSRPGTLLIADNVVRRGRVVDAGAADPDVQGVRRFTDALAAEPRVTATVVQTVGEKGYDGFAIGIVDA